MSDWALSAVLTGFAWSPALVVIGAVVSCWATEGARR